MWTLVERITITWKILRITMWTKIVFIHSIVVLSYLAIIVKGQKKEDGLFNAACPLDDDPFNPTLLPYEGDCTKFIKCSYGKAYTLSCPRGLEWSIEQNRCESPAIAKCDPKATTPHPPAGNCTYDFKPDPKDCTRATQCVNGFELMVQCPEELYWDQKNKRCDVDDSAC